MTKEFYMKYTIEGYLSNAYSILNLQISDPIVVPTLPNRDNSMPFWRSRITTLYIEWAKSFTAFQLLPYEDKV